MLTGFCIKLCSNNIDQHQHHSAMHDASSLAQRTVLDFNILNKTSLIDHKTVDLNDCSHKILYILQYLRLL